ncbi:MAG: DNA integrity scanning protein DisA nucleotide-binding domain protein [Clostridiales bacterium]|nr:DNA integrity scanning protein DisA nucleotide-binding domain protein [Clostridiales bacterium]
MNWQGFIERVHTFFTDTLVNDYIGIVLLLVMLSIVYYYVFKVLKDNKGTKFIPVIIFFVIFCGVTFALSSFESYLLLIIVLMIALLIFTMFHSEIKRSLLDLGSKHSKDGLTVSGVQLIIDETIRAVQNMSKKDIGALIVLSNDNLPEGIIQSGTVVNAAITSQMIEAVFYPKAPLHDGAMIIEGNKIYAAGCFLPVLQNENLPKDMGSRHRAALGVTAVASVTAIVVSEETGIISIVKNGAIKKRYADASDLKNALSEYYWSDITAEGKRL